MRAVAKAHRRTGVPITVHTHPGSRTGLEAQRVLTDEGVDPRRVVLGHSGDTTDVDHLVELAEAGFVLGFDRFGINLDTTFEARADTLVEMCRRGYADRIVLSQDASCYIDWLAPGVMDLLPQWHYTHIHDDVLPYVREHGVTEEQVETMLVANPRSYFETQGAYSRVPGLSRRRADRSRRDAGVVGYRIARISVLVLESGPQVSGCGRPLSTTQPGVRGAPPRAAVVEPRVSRPRALSDTISESSTSSPTRTPPMTRSVESMYPT
jgi:hypothetical protein